MRDTTESPVVASSASLKIWYQWRRAVYLPVMLLGVNGIGLTLAAPGGIHLWLLVPLGMVAVTLSMVVERMIPYETDWNHDHGDNRRDIAHAVVNESIEIAGVVALPLIVAMLGTQGLWPSSWPFVIQVVFALLVADAGITLTHFASHKIATLWRFHAVHHSITRFYGFNGLLKHPIHATLEMLVGVVPLLLLGLPTRVAAAVALCVAVQLLLQHSNADYAVGPLRYVLALNEGHRFHHLRWPTVGDVNFGLFTLIWDHILGTFVDDPARRFSSADLGIDHWPRYPTDYLGQIAQPFRSDSSLIDLSDVPM